MNETELLTLAKTYMADRALIVVVVLLILGYFLKKTPKIQDWLIPWLLTVTGILLAWGVLDAVNMQTTIQGILAAGIATLSHQLWKQTLSRRTEEQEQTEKPGGKQHDA